MAAVYVRPPFINANTHVSDLPDVAGPPEQPAAIPSERRFAVILKWLASLRSRGFLTLPRRYLGVSVATLAASFLAYIAIIDVGTLPLAGMQRVYAIIGILTISSLIGVGTNWTAIAQIRTAAAAGARYDTLRERLAPMLYAGMDEVCQRWAGWLGPGLELSEVQIHVDSALVFELHVFIHIDGHYRVVATSTDQTSPVRRMELKDDEGMVAAVATSRSAVVGLVGERFSAQLFSRNRLPIGEQQSLRPKNADKCNTRIRWIYGTPIFDPKSSIYASDRPLGVLAVDGLDSLSDEIYFQRDFQSLVDDVAAQLAPYLNALESLLADPKRVTN